jgi:hypothetical protein
MRVDPYCIDRESSRREREGGDFGFSILDSRFIAPNAVESFVNCLLVELRVKCRESPPGLAAENDRRAKRH